MTNELTEWNPEAVKTKVTEAIAYLHDVHGSVEVLDWWADEGHKRTWAIPWSLIPTAQHPAIKDTLADALEYLTEAMDNMSTPDVAIAIMRLDQRVRRVSKGK